MRVYEWRKVISVVFENRVEFSPSKTLGIFCKGNVNAWTNENFSHDLLLDEKREFGKKGMPQRETNGDSEEEKWKCTLTYSVSHILQ